MMGNKSNKKVERVRKNEGTGKKLVIGRDGSLLPENTRRLYTEQTLVSEGKLTDQLVIRFQDHCPVNSSSWSMSNLGFRGSKLA